MGVVQAFQLLLTKPREWHPNIRDVYFGVLNSQDATKLDKPFLEEEVFNALSNLNGIKLQVWTIFQWLSSNVIGTLSKKK